MNTIFVYSRNKKREEKKEEEEQKLKCKHDDDDLILEYPKILKFDYGYFFI